MKKLFLLLFLFMMLGSLSAQSFIGKINPAPADKPANGTGTVKILAVMVEFKTDKDETTFGDGTFGTIYGDENASRDDIIDPLPHDKTYFENHLQFAKNYYNKVSGGKANIEYTVLPEIITLPNTMKTYSPPAGSDNFENMGAMVTQVWEAVNAMDLGSIDVSEYNLFTIFHAGAGRDVSLPGSIGNERDLPSVYLGENSLRDIFGEDFNGIELKGNPGLVKNTLVLPETESRELEGIGGTVLLELSINGLIVASIASHMGLPDLFDTETGLSKIGRFGLMDGQAIFTYNGLFPPQPTLWEKMYLGWVDPVVIDPGEHNIDLSTFVTAAASDSVYLKVPVTETEYYLVENRQRDALKNGAEITYVSGGETFTKTYSMDTTAFYSYDTDTLQGVVTDVDEFDWALPGSGILIWHVDENLINARIAGNRINTGDKNGVDVEEADGIQDIGEEFTTITGDVVIGEGSYEDLWFASNPADLYENRFAYDTKPSTLTNSGARSNIVFSDFSDTANVMSFRLSTYEGDVKLVANTNLGVDVDPSTMTYSVFDNVPYLFINKTEVVPGEQNPVRTSDVYRFSLGGQLVKEYPDFSDFRPAVFYNSDIEMVIGLSGKNINVIYNTEDGEGYTTYEADAEFSAPPMALVFTQTSLKFSTLTSGGKLVTYTFNITDPDFVMNIGEEELPAGETGKQFVGALREPGVITENYFWSSGAGIIAEGNFITGFSVDNGNTLINVLLQPGNEITVIEDDQIKYEFVAEGDEEVTSVAPMPYLQGNPGIIVTQGNSLSVYNLKGVKKENYPFEPGAAEFTGSPLVSEVRAEGSPLIVAGTPQSIYTLDVEKGETFDGFPLAISGSDSHSEILIRVKEFFLLTSVSGDGRLKVWDNQFMQNIYWNGTFGDIANSSYIQYNAQPAEATEYMPDNLAYNWPNPVYGNETQIRFFVSEDSDIEIKIFDMAGDLVAELSGNGTGGYDNEIPWNVEEVESGVYFANLKAESVTGKTSSKIIKIAVVK